MLVITINILIEIKKTQRKVKIGTWDVRGIKDKKLKLEKEFFKADLGVLVAIETKWKGELVRMWYSGVEIHKRASSGIACMVRKGIENVVND